MNLKHEILFFAYDSLYNWNHTKNMTLDKWDSHEMIEFIYMSMVLAFTWRLKDLL